MIIADILNNHIVPFDIVDEKLKGLFSYFLHIAPTIDSAHAQPIQTNDLEKAWQYFIREIKIAATDYHVYAPGNIGLEILARYRLSEDDSVSRKSKRFVCNFKENEDRDLCCLLRHIRNSIAHGYVYVVNNGRKYILFDDYNRNHNLTARILFSQTDLSKLKSVLMQQRKTRPSA